MMIMPHGTGVAIDRPSSARADHSQALARRRFPSCDCAAASKATVEMTVWEACDEPNIRTEWVVTHPALDGTGP
jgi:hypothetical protein